MRGLAALIVGFQLAVQPSKEKSGMETVLIISSIAWLIVGVDLLVAFNKAPEDFQRVTEAREPPGRRLRPP